MKIPWGFYVLAGELVGAGGVGFGFGFEGHEAGLAATGGFFVGTGLVLLLVLRRVETRP